MHASVWLWFWLYFYVPPERGEMCENVRTDAFIALSLITYVNDRLRLLFTYVLQARFNAKKL